VWGIELRSPNFYRHCGVQNALRHIFAEQTVEINVSQKWSRLAAVACPCNGLALMDESLQLLPAVDCLDLSRNNFAKVTNLQKCTQLKFLDLGFNHISSVASLNQVR
jgi:Leucine-rich repeat (LRR) protein